MNPILHLSGLRITSLYHLRPYIAPTQLLPCRAFAESQQLVTLDTAPDDIQAVATTDVDVVDVALWLAEQYGLSGRQYVLPKVEKAAVALRQYDDTRTSLDLERDIIPKLQVLEGLSPGLGWKVFSRYPTEFIHPHATEYWGIMAAYLYTTGFSPSKIEQLFGRHICLFANIVQDPANLRALFDWLKALGLNSTTIARLIDKFPLVLQSDLENVLKPRVAYIENLGVTLPQVLSAIHRVPELLGVDSSVLQSVVDYLTYLGLPKQEIAKLFCAQPAVFVCSVETKLKPTVALLQNELGCTGELLLKIVAKSGLLSRASDTIRLRAAYWRDDLGLGHQGLLQALNRFPRLLVYPMNEEKYQRKVDFLREELHMDPAEVLAQVPQYVSYSLDKRIAPRAMAVLKYFSDDDGEKIAGANNKNKLDTTVPQPKLALHKLALSDEAFCKTYGIDVQEYVEFVRRWNDSEEAKKWRFKFFDDGFYFHSSRYMVENT